MENTIDLSLTLPAPLVWGGVTLVGVIVASWLVYISLPPEGDTPGPIDRLKTRLGMEPLHPVAFLVAATLWGGITLALVIGLFGLILQTLTASGTDNQYLFYVLRIAGLTGVLGAAIALPLTTIRLRLTQKQTETATESLFNDKINEATKGLYARRQVTQWSRSTGYDDHWQDDIVQRNAAIYRLEGLAKEKPAEVPRIARLLSVYVRELSAEVPAMTPPQDAEPDDLHDWTNTLPKLRPDMEKAAQTLGRLADIAPEPLENGEIDLRGANLQRADLTALKFDKARMTGAQLQGADLYEAQLQGAYLYEAQLQGANLFRAQLQGGGLSEAQLQGADLSYAQLQGADLVGAQLQGVYLNGAQLQEARLIEAQLQRAYLSGAQLQGTDLSYAQLQGANLFMAQLQGADLVGAQFDDATTLVAATLRDAAVKEVDFTDVPQIAKHLADMFGDATVMLPDNVVRPDHWPNKDLEWGDFETQWRAWQTNLEPGWDKPDD